MRKVLLLDNYDSFVYNISQYIGTLGTEVITRRNELSLREVERMNPDAIIVSPGPGRPEDAGNSCQIVEGFSQRPILGVCLGHQVIGSVFGAQIIHAPCPVHGKASSISHCSNGIYSGVGNPFMAIRYHSLAVSEESLPKELMVTSRTEDGIVMGIRHRDLPVEGVQFHPESVLTMWGKKLLSNFMEGVR